MAKNSGSRMLCSCALWMGLGGCGSDPDPAHIAAVQAEPQSEKTESRGGEPLPMAAGAQSASTQTSDVSQQSAAPSPPPSPSDPEGAMASDPGARQSDHDPVQAVEPADAPDAGQAMPVDELPRSEAMPCETEEEKLFSFFMVSYEAIRRESGSDKGFGGDLGGIEGADDICRRVAISSSECAESRTWRAFLSTTRQDAIDRIGTGPWHDRLGRLLANNLTELLNERPPNAHPDIINDFPNEFGVPNRNPDGTGDVDNHQTLTGSGVDGRLYTQGPNDGRSGPGGFAGGSTACMDGPWTPEKATCWDWTVSDPVGCPRVGHSWPREVSGVHWISVWNEGGCAPGVVLDDFTPPGGPTVGSFGGYGGFYCFALTP